MTDPESNSSAGAGQWILAGLVAANLSWTLLCLGGYRPETMVWSWLLTGGTLIIQLLIWAFSGDRLHPASWFLAPFLVYAAANVVWISPAPWLGWRDWLGWAHMAGTFFVVINGIRGRRPRKALLMTLAALGVISVLLACYQRFLWPDWLMLGRKQALQFIGRASGPFGIPNSLAAFLLLLIPASLALTFQRGAGAVQRVLFGYLSAVFLLGLGLTISRGAWLSLLGAMVLWPLFLRDRSWEWRISASIGAATLALLAGATTYATVPRVKHRFDQLVMDVGEHSRPIMWRASCAMFAESPALGAGAASFNTLFDRYRPESFQDEPQWAHNDFLNTLSDYGLLGFALCFGGMGWVAAASIRRAQRNGTVYGLGVSSSAPGFTCALGVGLMAFAFSLLVDFHLKIPALAMIVAVVAAECVARTWPAPEGGNVSAARQLGAFGGVLLVAIITLGLALPTFRSEAARYPARQYIDRLALEPEPSSNQQRAVLEVAAVAMAEACAVQAGNGQAWSDRAYVSELWARIAPSRANELGKEAEEFARRALENCSVNAEFWVRLGVSFDLQGRWGEGSDAFNRAVQLAPNNAIIWYYQAYHLSLTPAARALAIAALDRSLHLDPGLKPAIRLHQGLSLPH